MPPKVRITKEEIISTAVRLVQSKGAEAVNARSVAKALECSTQPIFSNFESMELLQQETTKAVYGIYLDFIRREIESGKYPPYKAMGMAYIRFAYEEKNLFRMLFLCDRTDKDVSPTADFTASVELIAKANGISKERAELMHLEMWSFVHGIGTMMATSFLSFDFSLVSTMLSDIYQGLRTRHQSEENLQ